MNFLKSTFLYTITALIVMIFWGKFVGRFGLIGSFLSACFLIGPLWYVNHFKNFITHKKDEIFIDMGLAIAFGSFIKSFSNHESSYGIIYSIMTLIILWLGACLGVIIAIIFENILLKNLERLE